MVTNWTTAARTPQGGCARNSNRWPRSIRSSARYGDSDSLGLELIDKDDAPASAAMDDLLEILKDDGIRVGKTGSERNVLTPMPPLIINDGGINQRLAGLSAAFDKVGLGTAVMA